MVKVSYFFSLTLIISSLSVDNKPLTSPAVIKTDYKVAFTITIIIVVAVMLVILFAILKKDFKLKNKKFNIRHFYKIFRGGPKPKFLTPPPVNIINNKIDDSSFSLNANYSKLITNASKLKQQMNRNTGECSNQNIYETLKDLTFVSANLNQAMRRL